jgi:hypothetical protein
MTLDYYLEIDDLVAFNKHYKKKSKSLKKLKTLIIAIGMIISIGPFILTVDSLLGKIIILLFGIISFLFLYSLLQMLLNHNYIIKWYLKSGKHDLGKHTVEIDQGGVTEKTAVSASSRSWDGIDRIEENDKYIFLFLSENSAYIIPKRAFSNESTIDAFLASAKNYKLQAQQKFQLNPPNYL